MQTFTMKNINNEMANPLGALSTSALSELLPSSSSVFPCEIHQLSSTSGSRGNPGFSWNWSPEPPPRAFREKEDSCLFAALLHTLHHSCLSLPLQFSSSRFRKFLLSRSLLRRVMGEQEPCDEPGALTLRNCKMLLEVRFVEHLLQPLHMHTHTTLPRPHH